MRSGGRYVLGVDALPRGRYAAVAVGRTVTSTFCVATPNGSPLPLVERVRLALIEAELACGAAPAQVRLVCVDDGSDGAELEDVQAWLQQQVNQTPLILDLVTPMPGPGDRSGQDDQAPVDGDALSVARACEAALW